MSRGPAEEALSQLSRSLSLEGFLRTNVLGLWQVLACIACSTDRLLGSPGFFVLFFYFLIF